MNFAERLRQLMMEKNFNQKQLSELTHITEASMSKYLKGTRTPRADVILALATALNVSTDELLGNDIQTQTTAFLSAKRVLARGKDEMSSEEKMMLIKLLTND